jgi:hypothetical protein
MNFLLASCALAFRGAAQTLLYSRHGTAIVFFARFMDGPDDIFRPACVNSKAGGTRPRIGHTTRRPIYFWLPLNCFEIASQPKWT